MRFKDFVKERLFSAVQIAPLKINVKFALCKLADYMYAFRARIE